ncbi:hypothetical protein F511_29258 [Dorcoceras hygrometricum]|uniref:Uncharacterized protein n=1 Tax=Dorcoceras hygrometricum TaxID=472368 RepID=A0A2Z7AVR1_9LAMI|nr:hypothetical protein F511_29258 [Dorcoceras hygrometricum]
MGMQTQQDKAGNKYEVNPQYEELSKQIPPVSNHAAGHFPKAHASRRTHAETFLKSFEVQQLRVSTSSEIQLLKWVENERAKQGEFSATNISKNKGWMRWKSREESFGRNYQTAAFPLIQTTPLQRSRTSAPADQQQPTQRKYYQQQVLRHAYVIISADSNSHLLNQ